MLEVDGADLMELLLCFASLVAYRQLAAQPTKRRYSV